MFIKIAFGNQCDFLLVIIKSLYRNIIIMLMECFMIILALVIIIRKMSDRDAKPLLVFCNIYETKQKKRCNLNTDHLRKTRIFIKLRLVAVCRRECICMIKIKMYVRKMHNYDFIIEKCKSYIRDSIMICYFTRILWEYTSNINNTIS